MNTKHDEALSTESAFSVVDTLKLALETFEHMGHIDSIFAGEFDGEIAAIREALALVNKVDQEQPAQQQEIDELTAQRDKLADILTRTANALKGQPPELVSHSWHDLPEVAQQLKSAQQQEPVGEITAEDIGRPFNAIRIGTHFYKEVPPVGTKLYTSPPASKPLTWERVREICKGSGYDKATMQERADFINGIRHAEAAHGIKGDA